MSTVLAWTAPTGSARLASVVVPGVRTGTSPLDYASDDAAPVSSGFALWRLTATAARAAAAAGWENGLVGGMFGQQISSTLPSGPGPSQAAAIQLNHSSAVAAVAAAAAAEKAKNSQVCKTEE